MRKKLTADQRLARLDDDVARARGRLKALNRERDTVARHERNLRLIAAATAAEDEARAHGVYGFTIDERAARRMARWWFGTHECLARLPGASTVEDETDSSGE